MVARQQVAGTRRGGRYFDCLRALDPGDERARDAGPSLPRTRTPQAAEPQENRLHHFCLQPAFHLARIVLRLHDHYRSEDSAELQRQPHRRPGHARGRTAAAPSPFHAFVVVVGIMILAGAVNTAIVGSNGVLNRVSEDGVLADWFRRPHPRFGTSHRIINLVVGLQLFTILLSRGDVNLLGQAYAFGVIWSFATKGLAVLVLRFTEPGPRDYRVPLNLRLGPYEIPLGLIFITLTLFATAVINLFTKQI